MTRNISARRIDTAWAWPLVLAAVALAAHARPATAAPDAAPAAAPAVPGFEIPPAPRDPEFPLLPGAIAPLETVPDGPAMPTTDVSAMDWRTEPVVLTTEETWDRSAESFSNARSRAPQRDVNDDSRAWGVGVALIVVLAAVAAMAAAIGAHAPRSDERPLSVVRFSQAGRTRS